MSGYAVAQADQVRNEILNTLVYGSCDVVVESPPGGGKTYLLEETVALLALHFDTSVAVACPSNSQADDLALRMVNSFPSLVVDRFISQDHLVPETIETHPRINVVTKRDDLCSTVIVATVDKLARGNQLSNLDFLLIDEAYQVQSAKYDLIREAAPRNMLIGDPGQISPIVRTSTRFWADDPSGPQQPAPDAILHRGEAHRFQLPLSRRLPQDSVDLIQPAFYDQLMFYGLAAAGQRTLTSSISGMTSEDSLLDTSLSAGSLAMIQLPQKETLPVDPDIVQLVAKIIQRLLARNFIYDDDGQTGLLTASDIGIVVFHREQVTALRQVLAPTLKEVYVETANRFQGLQRRVIITLHPLSGKRRPDPFSVEPGRMCVALSRHRIQCIILGRGGIPDILDKYVPDDIRLLGQDNDLTYSGWQSHQVLYQKMLQMKRVIEV